MSPDLELIVTADDTGVQRALIGVQRAIARILARDRWNRTHCSAILARTGRGVADNPVCAGRPVRGIRWSKQVREALDAKTVTGFEPAYEFDRPQPDGGITTEQLCEAEAALRERNLTA